MKYLLLVLIALLLLGTAFGQASQYDSIYVYADAGLDAMERGDGALAVRRFERAVALCDEYGEDCLRIRQMARIAAQNASQSKRFKVALVYCLVFCALAGIWIWDRRRNREKSFEAKEKAP